MAVEFHELTFRGRGAVAVIGVRGNDARGCIDSCFTPISGRSYSQIDRPIVYGTWNSTGEDLIVVRTGESFEIQCHGSVAAVDAIAADLSTAGAIESKDRNSWSFATNEHQAEIASAMESCTTQRTAKHLLQQYRLWQNPNFSDPDVVKTALSFSTFGEKLTQPWRIVLCGRPNVGKSSLINALAGFERAIVHPTAGTTRDLVSQHTAIDGWPVELIDSAGIRDAENQIERAGISKAREVIESADLVIHIVDATSDEPFDSEISQNRAGLVVINKVDLCDQANCTPVTCPVVSVSAKTGSGLSDFLAAISKAIVPTVPEESQLFPVTQSQREFLERLPD